MTAGTPHWTVERIAPVVDDLVRDVLARLRPGPAGRHHVAATGGETAVPADSLELLTLATAVSRQFHIHETGLDDLLLARRGSAAWAETVVRSRAVWDEAITFSTSGSTGDPKHCIHRMRNLEAELHFLGRLLAGRRRVVRVQPSHHIYGFLFSVMLPAALGIPVEDARPYGPASLLRRTRPGDLVVAHPHYLELAADVPGRAAEDVTVVTSTAPCDPDIWRRLAAAGVDRMVEVYGSSETAGLGWRQRPDQPFALMPQWHRSGDAGLLHRGDGGDPVEIPDRVAWTGDRGFQVCARLDGAVQVGGTNVFPGRVRELLLRHPAVADATVRLMRPDEGRRLKAFVVPRTRGTAALAGELTRWLETRTTPPEVPRAFRFGAALPRSEAGKPCDWDAAAPDVAA